MKRFAGLVLCGLLGGAGPALAEGVVASAVADWNQITVDAVTAGRPGPIGMVDIALVQIAVHDAVQAIEKRFEPYHFEMKACVRQPLRCSSCSCARRAGRHVSRSSRRHSIPSITTISPIRV